MASTADALYQTAVFGQKQVMVASSASTEQADVFARRERNATLTTLPEPRRLIVRLAVDGKSIEFTYTTLGGGLPPWADPVLKSLSERWGARPGWDSYQARPTNQRLVVKLLNLLFDLLGDDSSSPQITPLADGGVQAEWHSRGQDLEIVVSADEEPSYYYFNGPMETEEEGDLSNYAHIQDLITRLS
jgi:hypothetical protein